MEEFIPYKNYFLIAFGILIPVLSYAVYLQWKTFGKLKRGQKDLEERVLNNERARQESLEESIRIISMATLQGQCEISEACLRLANLLPLCKSVDHEDEKFSKLFVMYKEIKKLKTLQDRDQMRAAERFQEDQIRFACEDKFQEDIKKICEVLYKRFENKEVPDGSNQLQ